MTESTSESVECPICGQRFDPTAAGGWCTNPDCGEWQYLGDEVPEPAESAPAEASSTEQADGVEADLDDGWIQPSTDGEPTPEPQPGAETTPASSGDDSAVANADLGSTDDNTDEELTLEFGTAPGETGGESAEDGESEAAEEESAGDEAPEPATCPDCGADVGHDDAFCSACGAALEAEESPDALAQDAAPDRLALTTRGREVLVSPDQTVGREIRRIVTDTGGDEDDAVLIHREHVRFVREDGRFYVVDLGDNPTELNGSRLSKGDRAPVDPGDELALSDVVTLTVDRP